jgi:aconitate decarboxylase
MTNDMDPHSPAITAELCEWLHALQLTDIPDETVTRTRYLILDGLACAIIGSHLPWTEIGTKAVLSMESAGSCSVWGWNKVRQRSEGLHMLTSICRKSVR